MHVRLVAGFLVALSPALALADGGALPVTVGGYLQPQVRARQDSVVGDDQDGFRFRRGRLTARGERDTDDVTLGVTIEVELTPEVTLLDGYVSAGGKLPKDGSWKVDLGQVKAPFSRQALLSDSALQFVEKAEIVSLAPDRQIGGRARVTLPGVPFVNLWGGIFNGEGRNQIRNIDQNFLWVGRLEVRPIGRDAPLAEGGFVDQVTIGGGVTRNTIDIGDGLEKVTSYGGDASAAWHGISAAAELTFVQHRFPTMVQPDFDAQGWAAQAGYLLPLGGFLDERVEVSGRVEEIDRNDAVPVDQPGDPNQSIRNYTAGLSYYHARHDLKAQLTGSHVVEIEEESRTGDSIVVDNDVVLLQVTMRME